MPAFLYNGGMNELHALFQHLLAHLCSGGGIVLALVESVRGGGST